MFTRIPIEAHFSMTLKAPGSSGAIVIILIISSYPSISFSRLDIEGFIKEPLFRAPLFAGFKKGPSR
ncbi:MAG: hypothetical protein HY759_02100 [Nitrospirae bacterium]|nr:hypothetical protein [Nitrospirota bacterium]